MHHRPLDIKDMRSCSKIAVVLAICVLCSDIQERHVMGVGASSTDRQYVGTEYASRRPVEEACVPMPYLQYGPDMCVSPEVATALQVVDDEISQYLASSDDNTTLGARRATGINQFVLDANCGPGTTYWMGPLYNDVTGDPVYMLKIVFGGSGPDTMNCMAVRFDSILSNSPSITGTFVRWQLDLFCTQADSTPSFSVGIQSLASINGGPVFYTRISDSTLTTSTTGTVDCAACHPGHTTLELATNEHIRIENAIIGDRIRTAYGFEPITGFAHADNNVNSPYYYISTHNFTMAISAQHWMLVDGVEADPSTVVPGSIVLTPWGDAPVESVDIRDAQGRFHLFTPSGTYYADNILVTTYWAREHQAMPKFVWKFVFNELAYWLYLIGIPIQPLPPTRAEQLNQRYWIQKLYDSMHISKNVQVNLLWPTTLPMQIYTGSYLSPAYTYVFFGVILGYACLFACWIAVFVPWFLRYVSSSPVAMNWSKKENKIKAT